MTKKIVIVLLAVILCLGLVACKNDKDSHTLTFYGFDGKTEVAKMEISGDRINVPEAPEVEGYTFVGWYLDSADSTLKVDAEFFMRNSANKDRSAYARYVKNTYNLTFYSGEYKIAIMSVADIIDKGQSLPVPPPNPNYVFEGWYLNSPDSGIELTPGYFENNVVESNLNVYAKYTREQYTLTFIVDGKVYNTMLVSDQKITLPENPLSKNSKLEFAYWLPENSTIEVIPDENGESDYFVSNPAIKNLTFEAVFLDVDSDFIVRPSGFDTCTVTGYKGEDKNIVVPSVVYIDVAGTYTPYTVESIETNAFAGKDIESVVINNNIKKIGSNVFANCKNLKKVVINGVIPADKVGTGLFNGTNSVAEVKAPVWIVAQLKNKATLVDVTLTAGEKIDAEMFKDAKVLKNVVFSEDLKEIGKNAFAGCIALEAIHIPASVTDIALDAFVNCSSVKTITVAEENETYTSGDKANCIVKKNFVEVEAEGEAEGETVIVTKLDSLTLIVGCANTKIYEGINEIADYAFVGCTGLKNLSVPASVKKIAEGAFVGCINILSITAVDSEYYRAEGNCLIALSKDAEGKANNRLILGCQNSDIRRDLDITSISKYAFAGCKDLKIVCIPEKVASLEEGSFDGCTALASIVIVNKELVFDEKIFADCKAVKNIEVPEQWLDYFVDGHAKSLENITLTSGTEIPEAYFAKCEALTTITLPDTLTTIGTRAFVGCNKLTHVVIGEKSTLASIGRSAFEGCSKFVAIAYDAKSDVCVIPASISFVGDYAFKNTAIKNLEFAKDCELAVGYKVFANCNSLVSVSISSTVSSVDFDAFNGCTRIDTVSAPAEFIRVFSNANSSAIKTLTITEGIVDCYYIREMPNLKKLVIGAGVTAIDNKAFEGCSNLEVIEVDEENEKFYSAGNCIIQNGKVPTLVLGCTKSVIPAEVKTIASFAFAQSNITSIVIPATVTKIEDYAFSACRKLTEITIEDSNTVIADKAFDGCDKVVKVTIPANAIKYVSQVNLAEIVITSGNIVKGAFEDCLTLTTVTILPGVTVEEGAFEGCINVTTLTVPASALDNFSAEKVLTLTINDMDADIVGSVMSGYKKLKYLTIDAASSEEFGIEDGAFGTTVTNATVPAWAVSKMPESLVNLTVTYGKVEGEADSAVKFPALVTLVFADDVTEIGDYAFANHTALKNVSLPETLTVIGNYAFSGCTSIVSIDLSWVTNIGDYAFSGCKRLGNVVLTTVVEIGNYAFFGCVALATLDLPALDKIGDYAFSRCVALTKVVAPVLTVIGEGAFEGCEALVDATVPAFALNHMPATLTTLTVTSGKVEAEADAAVKFPALVTLVFADGVTEIGNNAFAYYAALETVILPETLTVIGEKAFYACEALADIDLSKVEKLGNNAFDLCKSLLVLDLTSLKEIGVNVFHKDVNDPVTIDVVVIPSLEIVGNEISFSVKNLVVLGGDITSGSLQAYTYELESLTIGAGVTYVAADAIAEGTVIATVIVDENNEYYVFEENKLINSIGEIVWDFSTEEPEA